MTTRTYGDDLDLDLDVPATKTTKLPTVLEQLRSELGKPSNAVKEVTLKVPSRDNLSVRFNTDLSLEQLDKWRIAARKNPKRDEIDILQFNLIVIVSQAKAIIFNGEVARDEDEKELNFRSQELIEMLGALDAKGAVKVLYDRDADILKIGNEILEAAGYGEEVDDTDPLI
jgi:hypothetical protein